MERRGRREFFRNALGAAAITAAGASALSVAGSALAQTLTDADILNFALNLEYLEANFYYYAVYGTAIPSAQTAGKGTPGAATGGRKVTFGDPVVERVAREIADDELEHVVFLRTQLGNSAVAQPAIDVGTGASGAFSSAARAAGLITSTSASFDAYANDVNFLLAAFIFEDVGVTAYKGAAPFISSPTYVEAGAGILAVEAYHAATIRSLLYIKGVETPTLRSNADAISAARDTLDRSSDLDQGISPTGSGATAASNITPLDGNGLAYSRTTGQVLNIVYLNNTAVASGGFFPAGVNGTIHTSAAN